ncbi:MAG: hypothetical protein HRT72_13635 [Flavobacteriales bacterium]|nr:hypothetical protein [Flavobacteriales bacterium]
MKSLNINISTLAIVLICSLSMPSTGIAKSSEYTSEKLVLAQYLFSCQSVVKNTIDIGDGAKQLKFIYLSLGAEYHEQATKSFNKLQGLDKDMEKKLIKNVTNLLKLYSDFFEKANSISAVEMTSSLIMDILLLEKITNQLYNSPK